MVAKKLPFRPFVRRRGMLWAAVCKICPARLPERGWRLCWEGALAHACSEQHRTAVRDQLVREGVAALAEVHKHAKELAASDIDVFDIGFDPIEHHGYWSVKITHESTVLVLRDFLVGIGAFDDADAAYMEADELISDAFHRLESSGMAEAA